jgi:hypothetical protein
MRIIPGLDYEASIISISQFGASGSVANPGQGSAALMHETLDRTRADAMDSQGVLVNYADLSNHPAYLEFRNKLSPSLRSFDPDSLASEEERMAFWINLNHTLVPDAVISFRIQQSVAEGWLGLLSFFRRAAYQIGGLRLSCASNSCPPPGLFG